MGAEKWKKKEVSAPIFLPKFLPWLICFCLAAATLALFWPVRHFDFLNWDDLTYISTNDHVRGGLTWDGIAWAFTHSYSSNWHPLTWISHMVDCQLFGLNPGAHHLVNVGCHIANTLLLFLLLRRATGALWRSALVAALFALHPLHIESVAWLAERKDVLSTFFFLLTLLAYTAYASREDGGNGGKGAGISRFWYVLALLLFALGLMSKPMLVTLPCVLLLLDYWPLGRLAPLINTPLQQGVPAPKDPANRFNGLPPSAHSVQSSKFKVQSSKFVPCLLEKLPFLALSAASCLITVIAQKRGGAVATFQMVPFSARLENAAVAYLQYLAKLFWPVHLSPIYPHPAHLDPLLVAGSVVLLLALTAAAWHWRNRFPFALMGWLWFLGTLVPVIGIVQVGSQAYADRYTYIPLMGLFVALVWVGGSWVVGRGEWSAGEHRSPRFNAFNPFNALTILTLAILALLAFRTSEQLPYWKDTASLFRHALDLDPNNVQALYAVGTDLVEHNQFDEGKVFLEKAIRLQPSYPEALGTLANLSDSQGNYEEAIHFYRAALQAQPRHDGVLNNLAWLLAACPNPAFRNGPEAVRLATQACELTGYSKPLFIGTLAAAQAEAGNFPAAIATAQRAAALATALRLDDIAARNHELIDLYRQGKAAWATTGK